MLEWLFCPQPMVQELGLINQSAALGSASVWGQVTFITASLGISRIVIQTKQNVIKFGSETYMFSLKTITHFI